MDESFRVFCCRRSVFVDEDCKIFLIDPTAKALKHFYELKDFYINNQPFTGGIQNDYYETISNIKPNFDKFSLNFNSEETFLAARYLSNKLIKCNWNLKKEDKKRLFSNDYYLQKKVKLYNTFFCGKYIFLIPTIAVGIV